MAHNLMESLTNSARFISMRGEPTWHGLGLTKAPGVTMTCAEAIVEAGIDFEYVMREVGYMEPDGGWVQDSDRQMVLRAPVDTDDQWRPLGVVSNGYRFLQNTELAKGLDAIATQTGWQFETAGALGQGETIFLTLRTGKASVFGDDYDTFIIVSDGKAANRALQISVAKVRVVCQNTLLMSDSGPLAKITIQHDEAVADNYAFWIDLIQQIELAQQRSLDDLRRMASVKISDKQAKIIINAAYPLREASAKARQGQALIDMGTLSEEQIEIVTARTTKASDRDESRRTFWQARRDASFVLYERFNAGQEQGLISLDKKVDSEMLAQLANTPYAALQAVTELADWGGRASESVSAASSLFGQKSDVKRRAWASADKLALSLVK